MASLDCSSIDNSFGPHAGRCRGGFDLTLLFEEAVLTIPITCGLILAVPWRVVYLLRKGTVKVNPDYLRYLKVVSVRAISLTLVQRRMNQ
jgi:ATP-binding cassette, subfamily C (CFTR/MRP), member 1